MARRRCRQSRDAVDGLAGAVTDPAAANENSAGSGRNWSTAATPKEAAERADAILVLTKWRQRCELDPATIRGDRGRNWALDGRNALDREPGSPRAAPTEPWAAAPGEAGTPHEAIG